MELKDLVGKHTLDTAVLMTVRKDVDVACFGMDGKTFTVTENPDDGYRSYLGDILVEDGHTDALTGAAHIGRDVVVVHSEKTAYGDRQGDCDIITVIDSGTGHVWMRFGTDESEDYYPSCVIEWNPMQQESST